MVMVALPPGTDESRSTPSSTSDEAAPATRKEPDALEPAPPHGAADSRWLKKTLCFPVAGSTATEHPAGRALSEPCALATSPAGRPSEATAE